MGQRRRIRLPLPTDPAVKAALITATASVLVAVIGAISAFAVGWLQVGPGARTPTATTVSAVTPHATAEGSGTSPDQATTTVRPGRQSVLDIVPKERNESDGEYRTGPQTVNAKRYERTLYLWEDEDEIGCADGALTYQLDRHYRRFEATVGLNDDSASGAEGVFTVLVDGKKQAAQTIGVGSTLRVTADVTGAFRMTLWAYRTCGLDPRGIAVWIDPVLSPTS
jgi:hypothetical protein